MTYGSESPGGNQTILYNKNEISVFILTVIFASLILI